ncbi:MAG: GNAT family N-acetyltransferase, partial [Rhizomicrobium sp.]
PALHALFRDPEAMRYGSRPPHTDMAQTMEILNRSLADNAAGRGDTLAVLHKGSLIGYAGLWRQDEIGFMFVRSIWSTGLAHEALTAVVARARAGGHRHITADVDPENIRSLKILKRLGFTITGEAKNTCCVAGKLADSVYLELIL